MKKVRGEAFLCGLFVNGIIVYGIDIKSVQNTVLLSFSLFFDYDH